MNEIMAYLSMTRLKLKHPWYLLPYLIQSYRIIQQIRASEGFICGQVLT